MEYKDYDFCLDFTVSNKKYVKKFTKKLLSYPDLRKADGNDDAEHTRKFTISIKRKGGNPKEKAFESMELGCFYFPSRRDFMLFVEGLSYKEYRFCEGLETWKNDGYENQGKDSCWGLFR